MQERVCGGMRLYGRFVFQQLTECTLGLLDTAALDRTVGCSLIFTSLKEPNLVTSFGFLSYPTTDDNLNLV